VRRRLHLWMSLMLVCLISLMSCSSLDTVNPDATPSDDIEGLLYFLSALVKTACDGQSSFIQFSVDPIKYDDGRSYYKDGWWIYTNDSESGRIYLECQFHDMDNNVQEFHDYNTLWVQFNMEFENYESGFYFKAYFARHSLLGFLYPIWNIKGNGEFGYEDYQGTLEIEDNVMNSLEVPACPSQGVYTFWFPPYLASFDLDYKDYIKGTLNTGSEVIVFHIDRQTGEITR
jgi:hypothetical protein